MAQQHRQGADGSAEAPKDAALRVLVVEGAPDLSATLAAFPGLAVTRAGDLSACQQALSGGRFAVVVLNPELDRAWPSAIAEQAIEVVAGRAALVIVCRTPEDQQSVVARIGHQAASLSRTQLAPGQLVDIVRGAAAQRDAAPR